MPRPARKTETRQDVAPKTAEIYHATQNPSNGKITIRRTPARVGFENTFQFNSASEMRTALSLNNRAEDVEIILQRLADSGTVEFSFSN